MLTFIISMRARALSKDWAHHTWLLEKTVDSILAQTDSGFDVVVVCHDIPDIPQVRHPKVHVLPVDFPPPRRTNDDMCIDKVLKVSGGIEWAMARGSDYVMFVDADDLVSRRLSAFVAAHRGENGWYFHDGFVHRYGERWVRTQALHHRICGTCVIVRTDLLRFAPSEFCRGATTNTLADVGIEFYLPHLAAQDSPIKPLPFPGAIYILHPDSTSEVPGGDGYRLAGSFPQRPPWRRALGWVKRTAIALPTVRPVTAKLRTEFTIPVQRHAWPD